MYLFSKDTIKYELFISRNMGVSDIIIPLLWNTTYPSNIKGLEYFLSCEGNNIDDLIFDANRKLTLMTDNYKYHVNNKDLYLIQIMLEISPSSNFSEEISSRTIDAVNMHFYGKDIKIPVNININIIEDNEQELLSQYSGLTSTKKALGYNFLPNKEKDLFLLDDSDAITNLLPNSWNGFSGGSFTIEKVEYAGKILDIGNLTIIYYSQLDEKKTINVNDINNINLTLTNEPNIRFYFDRSIKNEYKDLLFIGDTFVIYFRTLQYPDVQKLYGVQRTGYVRENIQSYLDNNNLGINVW
jgi:hypothetical protein